MPHGVIQISSYQSYKKWTFKPPSTQLEPRCLHSSITEALINGNSLRKFRNIVWTSGGWATLEKRDESEYSKL